MFVCLSARYDGKEYLLAAGQDERCQLYSIRKEEKTIVEDLTAEGKDQGL